MRARRSQTVSSLAALPQARMSSSAPIHLRTPERMARFWFCGLGTGCYSAEPWVCKKSPTSESPEKLVEGSLVLWPKPDLGKEAVSYPGDDHL